MIDIIEAGFDVRVRFPDTPAEMISVHYLN